MKISYLFLLSVSATGVYAAPPGLENYDSSTTQIINSINKLHSDVSSLNNRVSALEGRQSSSNTYIPAKQPVNLGSMSSSTAALLGEKDRYNQAYSVFTGGGYDRAIAEFQAIIQTYPNGSYADNAQYWIGEALLRKGDKQRAMQAFDGVVRIYPKGNKVPDALLKLAMTQYSLGNRTKAKEYYDYLIASYPGTNSANIAITNRAQAGLN
jgi:tol-pal system protein YbgF